MPPEDKKPEGAKDGQPLGRILPIKVPAAQAKDGGAEGAQESEGAAKTTSAPGSKVAKAQQAQPRPKAAGGQERQFLPAALEILETPANPAGRAIALTIVGMFTLAIAWSFIGKIDIVALAPGRVVPVGGSKLVQSLEMGSVRAIHVADGQRVAAGEALVELDPTESEVDLGQVVRARGEAAIEASRLEAYIQAIRGEPLNFTAPALPLDAATIEMHRAQLESDLAAFEARIEARKADLSRRKAESAGVRAEVAKLQEMTPLLAEREANLHQLMTQGHTPKPSWQQAKAQLIDAQHNLTIRKHRLSETRSGIKAAEKELSGLVAATLQEAYARLAQARKAYAQADLALRKVLNREKLQTLRAPVSGTVQQLRVHTVGGVVQPAQPLMVIVPDEAPLEIQALVLNRDKGVVFEGQRAEVKFEAFEFTKYGTVEAEVVSISEDAVEDERFGPVYDTRLVMAQRSIRVDGKDRPLTPGMSVMVDIKIGQRRVIDFLLSPLKRYQNEAIRER